MSALRIQVSEQCKDILDQLGAYEFDDRGQVEVKVGCRSRLLHVFVFVVLSPADSVNESVSVRV